MTMIWYQCPY